MVCKGFSVPSFNALDRSGLAGIIDVFIKTHVCSVCTTGEEDKPADEPQHRHIATWPGITTASILYMQAVLGIWNDGYPTSQRLHRRLLLILKQDIEKSEERNTSVHDSSCDILFWKVFTAAYSLAKATLDPMLQELYFWFCSRIRSWSKASRVGQWLGARVALARIVWPASHPEEMLAEALWDTANRIDTAT